MSWDIQAPLVVDTVALYARVIDPVAYDINKYVDSLVVLQQGEDSTVVTIVAGGAVAITNIRLITPPGAVDDTISTSQSFTLEGAFSFVGSVDTVGRRGAIDSACRLYLAGFEHCNVRSWRSRYGDLGCDGAVECGGCQ